MLKKFVPLMVVDHFSDINIEKLKDNNIKLVLLDIDNTLVAPDDPHVSSEAKQFIESILANDIEVVLISNNTQERVSIFNEPLNLKIYPMAFKPFSRTYRKIKADFSHLDVNEMLSIGDQVLTDVLGSNLAKIKVILVQQVVEKDLIFTKINRFFESVIIKILKRRKLWPNANM